MFKFVEKKSFDWSRIRTLLALSEEENYWSNFGPINHLLEEKIHDLLNLSDNLSVINTCNATIALHALVEMQHVLWKKPLRWCVSSYGFYCTVEGPLKNAQIVDCAPDGLLDLSLLDPDTFDALLVTNIFGAYPSMQKFREYCQRHQKILLIDSAMSLLGSQKGPDEIISFHHTKPWGFGEGGCAIVSKEHESLFRLLISFGHLNPSSDNTFLDHIKEGTNGKLSDIGAAFILARLEKINDYADAYREQYQRIAKIGKRLGFKLCVKERSSTFLPQNVPLLAPFPIFELDNPFIELKKYYWPLGENTPVAQDLFDRIVNVPCHKDIQTLSDETLEEVLQCVLNPKLVL